MGNGQDGGKGWADQAREGFPEGGGMTDMHKESTHKRV
jgi:hypothetical protein